MDLHGLGGELRRLSGLETAEAAAALLRLLARWEEAAPNTAALRALLLAGVDLQRRSEDAGGHGALTCPLWRRLHEACKRLAAAAGAQPAGLFDHGRPQQEALALAFSSAWQSLRAHVLGYSPLCAGFWRDCHRLFAMAGQRGWERRAPGDGAVALGDWYRRLLLLGMSASNRLDAQRQHLLLDWVETCGSALKLTPWRGEAPEQPCWLVPAEADMPGRFVDGEREAPGDARWLADAGPALERLRGQAERRRQQLGMVEWQMLARLEAEWRSPPQRRHPRLNQRNGQRVALLAGFDACWRLARAGLPPDAAEAADLLLGNLSASGMRLCGDFGPQEVQAGSIAMVKRRGFGWQLGLVRWISLPGGEQPAECGIEFVGKRPMAVEAAAVTSHPDGGMENGLLLHGERDFRQRGVLALAGRRYQAMRQFKVRGAGGEWLVRAQRLLQQTGSCQLIEVRLEETLARRDAAS
ncbi:hypothetical protein KIF53_03665 [Chromobacterium subtsugae]|uniref:PilZ domain-containing protein n=1 Tax=Chromobacterium subtsugae TaxID=251747 RepID=A0ABS7F9F9_9NEIS|nr:MULTISPECIES: hypothetical protein [Chromobacterium]MBW7565428.1 hypothetical protein [Chromobacterium subtsugae]MBW8286722.1 hypothetical protein [Chromobacterium subtsugae]OBU85299.1 hypothetical protein MY55_17545 [Chromobacterium subtsugae]WSE90798.1 hypothetical protein U6115_18190 [Chromobacterium subtsugae]WVH59171.1 hypothetical protein U6151_18220 [Chromobacterium subtsugae]